MLSHNVSPAKRTSVETLSDLSTLPLKRRLGNFVFKQPGGNIDGVTEAETIEKRCQVPVHTETSMLSSPLRSHRTEILAINAETCSPSRLADKDEVQSPFSLENTPPFDEQAMELEGSRAVVLDECGSHRWTIVMPVEVEESAVLQKKWNRMNSDVVQEGFSHVNCTLKPSIFTDSPKRSLAQHGNHNSLVGAGPSASEALQQFKLHGKPPQTPLLPVRKARQPTTVQREPKIVFEVPVLHDTNATFFDLLHRPRMRRPLPPLPPYARKEWLPLSDCEEIKERVSSEKALDSKATTDVVTVQSLDILSSDEASEDMLDKVIIVSSSEESDCKEREEDNAELVKQICSFNSDSDADKRNEDVIITPISEAHIDEHFSDREDEQREVEGIIEQGATLSTVTLVEIKDVTRSSDLAEQPISHVVEVPSPVDVPEAMGFDNEQMDDDELLRAAEAFEAAEKERAVRAEQRITDLLKEGSAFAESVICGSKAHERRDLLRIDRESSSKACNCCGQLKTLVDMLQANQMEQRTLISELRELNMALRSLLAWISKK